MHGLYQLISGPLVWLALAVFIGGSLYRLVALVVTVHRKERFIFGYMSLRYSLRSILHWLVPFATVNWRRHPVLTVVTFAFHICVLVTPLFLLSHLVLWEEAWNWSWAALPDRLADAMTVVVIAGCLFFLVRRLVRAEVAYLTSAGDWVLLALVAAPFVTGFIAYHQFFAYRFFLLLHMLSGEILLMAIPFTRLSHMLLSPFVRAYTGSEFGKVRCARDW